MAPRRTPYRRPVYAGRPNTFLVVILVFLILLSIGLGVGLYLDFAGKAKAEAELKKANDATKSAEKVKLWYQFQALEARAAVGAPLIDKEQPLNEQNLWATLREEFKRKKTIKEIEVSKEPNIAPEYANVAKWVEQNDKLLVWDATGRKFLNADSYTKKLGELEKKLKEAQDREKDLGKEKEALFKKYTSLSTQYTKWMDVEADKIKKGQAAALAAAETKTAETEKLFDDNTKLKKDMEELKFAKAKELRDKDREIKDLNDRLQDNQPEGVKTTVAAEGQPGGGLDEKPGGGMEGKPGGGMEGKPGGGMEGKPGGGMEEKPGGGLEEKPAPRPARPSGIPHALFLDVSTGKPLWDRPKGEVVDAPAGGRIITINLGTVDGVKAGLTFNVFAKGPSGYPVKGLKATVEVSSVVGEHTALARITSLFDSEGKEIPLYDTKKGALLRAADNPIQKGDLLFNMFWKSHVALAGKFNFTGFGAVSAADEMRIMKQVMNLLEKESIIVDAYLDPVDAHVEGKITSETQFLIVGGVAELKQASNKEAGAGDKAGNSEQLFQKTEEMFAQATKHGMFVISAKNFGAVLGFRPVAGATSEAVGTFEPTVPFAGRPPALGAKQKEKGPGGNAPDKMAPP